MIDIAGKEETYALGFPEVFSHYMAFEQATFVLVCSQVLKVGKFDVSKLTYKPVSEEPEGGFAIIHAPYRLALH